MKTLIVCLPEFYDAFIATHQKDLQLNPENCVRFDSLRQAIPELIKLVRTGTECSIIEVQNGGASFNEIDTNEAESLAQNMD